MLIRKLTSTILYDKEQIKSIEYPIFNRIVFYFVTFCHYYVIF